MNNALGTVKLTGITRHGKNRVNQHGNIWHIVDETLEEFLLISLGQTFSLGRGVFSEDKRWVFKKNDPDFRVERIE